MAVDVPEDRMMLPDSGCLYKRQEQSLQKNVIFWETLGTKPPGFKQSRVNQTGRHWQCVVPPMGGQFWEGTALTPLCHRSPTPW